MGRATKQSAGKFATLKTVKLSLVQKQIVVGTLLGDGYIHRDRYGGCRLEIKHSQEQRLYVTWLFNKLESLCPGCPKQRADNKQWRFVTSAIDDLSVLHNTFYKDRRKIVPSNISELLASPLALAVWYMDDGSLDFRPKSHYAFTISTNSFSVEECDALVKMLKSNFDISASIQTPLCRGKRYPQLYIGKDGRDVFTRLIKKFVVTDCFRHKLPPSVV